jgi:two-component system nitrogen regulation sensor histidine kinase NtrY
MCALVSFVPTVIVAIFSTYFFNFGIQSWFDQRINNVLDQSLYVAESYIDENKARVKEAASSISLDLSQAFERVPDSDLLAKFLNAQTEVRSLNEAIVFQRTSKVIIAQSDLSFSLSFTNVPEALLDRSDNGEIVEIQNDKNKIQYLVKLADYDDAYLIIGRFVDQIILDYIDKTHGALSKYSELRNKIHLLQLNFSTIFILVALILILSSFYVGLLFADKLVRPINNLVLATEKVKSGDLTVQVQFENKENNNEIDILISAFNMMIRRLDYQQKDLLVAQKALAWSEVARRVAHEIKNPLTSIYLSCERLSKKYTSEVSDTEGFAKYTNNIFRLSDNIKTILTEFVNFARLPNPVFAEFELVSFVMQVIESRSIICENIEYIFETDIDSFYFQGDQDQINQVLVNLLKNSEESILENNKDIKKIKINLFKKDNLLELELIDSGVGFAVDTIDKATEAYFTTRTKGTGLGLAIVKKIIQDHNGKMNIDNNENGGAKITISFELDEQNKK